MENNPNQLNNEFNVNNNQSTESSLVEQNPTNVEYLDATNSPINKNKKTQTCLSIFLDLIVIILIGLIGFFGYYVFSMRNPQFVFTNIANKLFNNVESVLKNNSFNLEESALVNGNLKINTNIEEYEFLNKETIKYTTGYDLKEEKIEFGLEIEENTKKVIATEAEIKNNNIYIYLNDLFERVIVLDDATIKERLGKSISEIFDEVTEEINQESTEDLQYITEEMKKITGKALKSVNYEKTSENIKINEKEIKTNKMVLNLNKDNVASILTTYVHEILNNEELINKLINILDTEKDEFVKQLNEVKKNIDSLEDFDEKAELIIYTSGILSKIVKISFEVEDEEIMYYVDYKDYKAFYYDELLIEINDKKINVKHKNELKISGTANSIELNKLDISFKSEDDEYPFNGSFKFINEKNKSEINFEYTGEESNKLVLEIINNKVNKKENNSTISFEFINSNKKIGFTNICNILLGEDIATNEVKNTINFNELTDENVSDIKEKLIDKLENSELKFLTDYMTINEKMHLTTFMSVVNSLQTGASKAISLITVGTTENIYYTEELSGTYCFTVNDLVKSGMLTDSMNLTGTITVYKAGNDYIYRTELYNDTYYIKTYNNKIFEDDIHEYSSSINIKESCNNTYKDGI